MRDGGAAGTPLEVFTAFLKLGLTSFGGPIAHLACFRREFVERRQWVSDAQYAQLLALCQFLPGPASSQMGFSLGLLRAGWPGALLAFAAFTLPSALLMFAFAIWLPTTTGPLLPALIHGLHLVAVAVVAAALIGMGRQLCTDLPTRTLAVATATVMLLGGTGWLQAVLVGSGAVAGLLVCRRTRTPGLETVPSRVGLPTALVLLGLFAIVLVVLVFWARRGGPAWQPIAAFYESGALVFGGGHVVLPLLQSSLVEGGWIDLDRFLAGYGAAQAVPGPMFTLATFLGASLPGEAGGLAGAVLATCMVFAPGLLLVAGMQPFWGRLAGRPGAAALIAGANATVVGLLAAAFVDPVFSEGIRNLIDAVIALAGVAIALTRRSSLWVVAWCAGAALIASLAGFE